MRIAIVTLPLHTNYGGILQAYALRKVLMDMGHECDLIDKDIEKEIKPHLPRKIPCVFISSSTGEGIEQLKNELWKALQA